MNWLHKISQVYSIQDLLTQVMSGATNVNAALEQIRGGTNVWCDEISSLLSTETDPSRTAILQQFSFFLDCGIMPTENEVPTETANV